MRVYTKISREDLELICRDANTLGSSPRKIRARYRLGKLIDDMDDGEGPVEPNELGHNRRVGVIKEVMGELESLGLLSFKEQFYYDCRDIARGFETEEDLDMWLEDTVGRGESATLVAIRRKIRRGGRKRRSKVAHRPVFVASGLVVERGFEDENDLVEALLENDSSLELALKRKGIRVVGKHIGTRQGEIDLLATDPKGRIYIIEVKLKSNTTSRNIHSQLIEYGSLLWSSSGSGARLEWFEKATAERFDVDFRKWLKQRHRLFCEDPDHIISKIESNMERGRFSYVAVLDDVTDDMRRVFNYLRDVVDLDVHLLMAERIPSGLRLERKV